MKFVFERNEIREIQIVYLGKESFMARDMGVEIFVLQRFQVMKDWSDLEERYQDIRAHDPVAADAFKRWMTARFQETVAALEESGAAEKHQLSAMHQQRVQVRGDYTIRIMNVFGVSAFEIFRIMATRYLINFNKIFKTFTLYLN